MLKGVLLKKQMETILEKTPKPNIANRSPTKHSTSKRKRKSDEDFHGEKSGDEVFGRPDLIITRKTSKKDNKIDKNKIVAKFRTDAKTICFPDEFKLVFKLKVPYINNIILVHFDRDGWCLGIINRMEETDFYAIFYDREWKLNNNNEYKTLENVSGLSEVKMSSTLKSAIFSVNEYAVLFNNGR